MIYIFVKGLDPCGEGERALCSSCQCHGEPSGTPSILP